MPRSTHLRTCAFCEAACGVEVEVDGGAVRRVRGDRRHPDSKGYLCPKASALGWLHDDPDRLRTPMIRRDGTWQEAGWDEAFEVINRRFTSLLAEHGPGSLGLYVGNPASYDLSCLLYGPDVYRLFRHRFSPATMDSVPKQFATGHMFGGESSVPVPDLERTHTLWIMGANPAMSNGSMIVAPDVMSRLERITQRGGTVVVVDPRRSETAARASEHVTIRPGTDALFLAAVIHTLFEEDLVRLGHLATMVAGIDELRRQIADLSPERVASACAIDAPDIRRLTRQFASSEAGVVYGRLGTCTQEFGTIASWFIEVVNILTGNLDRPGGAMFAWPLTGSPITEGGARRPPRHGRWNSRVRGLPEVMGELPVACLAEDILAPGEGRIRAMVTVAGNPALSVPDPRIVEALDALEFHVAVDLYLNETTSRADVVLPAESHLHRPHFPLTQYQYMARQVARWSPPVLPPQTDRPRDWEVLLRLASILRGEDVHRPLQELDDEGYERRLRAESARPGSRLAGRDVDDLLQRSRGRGVERLVDLSIRTGPHGDRFGGEPQGLTLDTVRAHPHGLDLGGLQPRLPDVIGTASGLIELAPPVLVADLPRLRLAVDREWPAFALIGRRNVRSNNSWMHNLGPLARGRDRTPLLMNPVDAEELGLATGRLACLQGSGAEVTVTVAVDDAMARGVVSLPHGWGHDHETARLSVASGRPGANANRLGDPSRLDQLTGTSVLNGIPVEVRSATSQPAENPRRDHDTQPR